MGDKNNINIYIHKDKGYWKGNMSSIYEGDDLRQIRKGRLWDL